MQQQPFAGNINGLEIFRQFTNRFTTPVGAKSTSYLTKLIKPTFDGNSFEESLAKREYQLNKYEQDTTTRLPDSVKVAIVINETAEGQEPQQEPIQHTTRYATPSVPPKGSYSFQGKDNKGKNGGKGTYKGYKGRGKGNAIATKQQAKERAKLAKECNSASTTSVMQQFPTTQQQNTTKMPQSSGINSNPTMIHTGGTTARHKPARSSNSSPITSANNWHYHLHQ